MRASQELFALVLAGTALNAAQAADPVVTIDCANPRVPRMVDVGVVTGIDNVGAAFAEREELLHQAARLCNKTRRSRSRTSCRIRP